MDWKMERLRLDKEIVFSKDIQIAWSSDPGNQLYYLKLDI